MMHHITPSRRVHSRPTWRDNALGLLVVLLLVIAATVGHSAVSARVAHGQGMLEQMPELRIDLLLPYVAR